MHPAFRLAEQLEGAHCSVPYPGGEIGPLNNFDEFADVAVGAMVSLVLLVMLVWMLAHQV
jgi:hypothetical protein